jgi:hypothetical protein
LNHKNHKDVLWAGYYVLQGAVLPVIMACPGHTGWKSSGMLNEEITMNNACVQEYMLEEKLNSSKTNIQGTPIKNSDDVSQ